MTKRTWTKERTALLKRLWRQGKSSTEISRTLGEDIISRSAVLGKIHRLGLSNRDNDEAPARKSRKGIDERTYAPSYAGYALAKHKAGTCMYPVGDTRDPDFRFCGAPIHDKRPYCASCAAIAYKPVEKKG